MQMNFLERVRASVSTGRDVPFDRTKDAYIDPDWIDHILIKARQDTQLFCLAMENRRLKRELEKMVKPKESDALKAFNAKPVPAGYTAERIPRVDGPILRFHGKILGEDEIGKRDRRLVLRLWETPAGAWIAETVNLSDIEHEQDIHRALVIPADQVAKGGPTAAMDFFGWTNPARSFARAMGWVFEEFVE